MGLIHTLLWLVGLCILMSCITSYAPQLAPTAIRALEGAFSDYELADISPPRPQRNARDIAGPTHRKRLTPFQKKTVGARAHWRCQLCYKELTATYEVDHILPVSQGGSNSFSNLRALCRECHGRVSMDAYAR